jgi:hypothetical protein
MDSLWSPRIPSQHKGSGPTELALHMPTQGQVSEGILTRGLEYEHMIKARAHKEGVRIGKTPKKLASICCP